MRTLLITGAAGFIGSNFCRLVMKTEPQTRLVAFDLLTYAGNLANLADLLPDERLAFVRGDICDGAAVEKAWSAHGITDVVHFAAESHVDRSIQSSLPFIQTNAVGTQVLLDVARANRVNRFVHVSTDEVYGSLPEDRPEIRFTEETPLAPNSPYSASKAASDCLARAAFHTFGLPVTITRCSNNYGPYQFPEKLIPLFITHLLEGRKVPLYGDGMNVRDWLHVEDHCEAILAVLDGGRPGEVYNIGGDNEIPNRRVTEVILAEMGKRWNLCVEPVTDRPGHDRRYAIDASKIRRELGWKPRFVFESAIRSTIKWYLDHEPWWRAIKSGAHRSYEPAQFGAR